MSSRTRLLPVLLLLLAGCAGSRVSRMHVDAPIHSVSTIALAPSGGLLADAIGVELFNRGITVIDTHATSQMLVRLNLSEVEIMRPQHLSSLRDEKIDAYLSARSAAGMDGRPQSASVRLNSTHTGQILAGVTWQNGWGGMHGSIADRLMRKDLNQAAQDIARELMKQLDG